MKITKAISNRAPIIALHGEEGRGKTTLATKAPKPLAFLFEDGLPRGVSVDAVEGAGSFESTMTALREVFAAPGDYRSIVIDTLDAFEDQVIAATCTENNWKNIEAPPFGKGYVVAGIKWRHFLKALSAIRDKHGIAIIMCCHSQIERIDDPRAPTYTSYQLRLHRRARSLVMDACDAVLFIAEDLRVITENSGFNDRARGASDSKRYLFTEGRPAFAAKNRFGLPAKIPIGLDFDFRTLSQFWETTS
jgi:hypothetical protein